MYGMIENEGGYNTCLIFLCLMLTVLQMYVVHYRLESLIAHAQLLQFTQYRDTIRKSNKPSQIAANTF